MPRVVEAPATSANPEPWLVVTNRFLQDVCGMSATTAASWALRMQPTMPRPLLQWMREYLESTEGRRPALPPFSAAVS